MRAGSVLHPARQRRVHGARLPRPKCVVRLPVPAAPARSRRASDWRKSRLTRPTPVPRPGNATDRNILATAVPAMNRGKYSVPGIGRAWHHPSPRSRRFPPIVRLDGVSGSRNAVCPAHGSRTVRRAHDRVTVEVQNRAAMNPDAGERIRGAAPGSGERRYSDLSVPSIFAMPSTPVNKPKWKPGS